MRISTYIDLAPKIESFFAIVSPVSLIHPTISLSLDVFVKVDCFLKLSSGLT